MGFTADDEARSARLKDQLEDAVAQCLEDGMSPDGIISEVEYAIDTWKDER